jgi:predicted metal-dependent phosphoesterase TrpH
MRADLHVHTWASAQSGSMRFLRSRDCYSSPFDVYDTARARGMDVVTITDHDSIDGCLELLDRHPDLPNFICGEEVTSRFPQGDIEVHLAVYGMTEALHRELQPLRGNVFDVIACLREADVFFALNHLLHFYRGQTPLDDYLRLLLSVPALEVRNGAMLASHNAFIEHYARTVSPGWSAIGGSDAHTLRRVGRTWTEVPDATTAGEFLAGLRAGRCSAGGVSGSVLAISGDVYGVVGRYMASLAGIGPSDHRGLERLACLVFSVGSIPFQFTPLLVAIIGKLKEQGTVRSVRAQLAEHLAPGVQVDLSVERAD